MSQQIHSRSASLLLVVLLFAACILSACSGNTRAEPISEPETTETENTSSTLDSAELRVLDTMLAGELVDTKNGYAIVKNQSGILYGLQDIDGNLVIDFKYDELSFLDIDGKNYLDAVYEGNHGVIDVDDNTIIQIQFDSIFACNSSLLIGANRQCNLANLDNPTPLVFNIYNKEGNLTGQYTPGDAHSILVTETATIRDMTGDVICIFGQIYHSMDINDSSDFTDIVKADGSVIRSIDEITFEPIVDQLNHRAAITQTNGTTFLVNGDGSISNEYTVDGTISGWDRNGHAFVSGGTVGGIRLTDLESGEILQTYDEAPTIDFTDSLILVNDTVYDRTGNLIMTVSKKANLLGDKVLYKDMNAGTYKLINGDGTPVFDDRYFECYTIEDSDHKAFFLKNGDGQICLISEDGEMLNDYGTFSCSGSDSSPTIQYMGVTISEYTIDDGYLTFWFSNYYTTFLY